MKHTKQLITRIDEDLHARLKERAAAEGRSVNALVTNLLERELHDVSDDDAYIERLRREGRIVVPPQPEHVPTYEELVEAGRGAGDAVSKALEADRAAR